MINGADYDLVCIGIVHDVLARNDIQLIHGRAQFEDAHTIAVESLEGRRRLNAARTLIAVGTMPSKPARSGAGRRDHHGLRYRA